MNEIYTSRNYIKLGFPTNRESPYEQHFLYRFIGIIIGHLDKWQKTFWFTNCFHQYKRCAKGL